MRQITGAAKLFWLAYVVLFLLGLFFILRVADAQLSAPRPSTFNWKNPTANTDGSAFNPAAELERTEIWCGVTPTYDGGNWTHLVSAQGAAESASATIPAGRRYCAAWALSKQNQWSDASASFDLNTLVVVVPPDPVPVRLPRAPAAFVVK